MTAIIHSMEEFLEWLENKNYYDLVAYKFTHQRNGSPYTSNVGAMASSITRDEKAGTGFPEGAFLEILY